MELFRILAIIGIFGGLGEDGRTNELYQEEDKS